MGILSFNLGFTSASEDEVSMEAWKEALLAEVYKSPRGYLDHEIGLNKLIKIGNICHYTDLSGQADRRRRIQENFNSVSEDRVQSLQIDAAHYLKILKDNQAKGIALQVLCDLKHIAERELAYRNGEVSKEDAMRHATEKGHIGYSRIFCPL